MIVSLYLADSFRKTGAGVVSDNYIREFVQLSLGVKMYLRE